MKKYLLILFLLGITFSQEVNHFNLSGNLAIDSKLVFAEQQDELNQEAVYEQNKKSPFLSALMSLALPGSGQFYNRDYWKAAIFLAVEAAAITFGVIYDGKGDDQTIFYENYADQYWSVDQYARWTYDNASRINPLVDPTQFNLFDPQGNLNWSELNRLESAIGKWYSHRLPRQGDQQYYEMIGKYQQFNAGWSDFTEDPNNPYTYGDPLTERFHYYSEQRGLANDYYNIAKWAVIGIVTNHILSAVEAAFASGTYNRRLESQLNIKKEQIGFHTEYYPELSIRFNF
ncbi:hypothetical protein ASZ90_005269 [hydrocarbon metagenome]|uniref:DUF5683 domain-containing protein n=1 Tax=hydrocarbon metagenome TaxID=938273 RepID=A0A0W8FW30_9ZZZZ